MYSEEVLLKEEDSETLMIMLSRLLSSLSSVTSPFHPNREALKAAIQLAETTDREVAKGLSYLSQREKGKNYIDDLTWENLEMDRIYEKICYCHSAWGEEYFYLVFSR